MADYLSKPIELRQLGSLIAKWLGSDSIAANSDKSDEGTPAHAARAA